VKKKQFVLPNDHFIARPPLLASAVLYMALDMYSAPGWVWGVSWTIMGLLWVAFVMLTFQQRVKRLPGYGKQDE